jgi:hypothetical protein
VFIIWANLDAEARWANQTLPKHVLEKISAAAITLAAFAPEGEPVELWVPAAVDAARMKIENVTVHAGVPARQDLVWAKPHAKAANDRRMSLGVHETRKTLLPGQRLVTSIDEFASATGKWVAKAPWTSAGRDRAHGDGPPTGELAALVTRLIAKFGALLFEPWCERELDVGVCGEIDQAGIVTVREPHTLLSDPRGGFVGIDLAPPPLEANERAQLDQAVEECGRALHALEYSGPFSVDAFVYKRYIVAGEDTYETTFGDGYFPFAEGTFLDRTSADAFIAARPRPPDASTMPIVHTLMIEHALHAPCEINARYTFGHVAHALHRRFGARVLGFGEPPPGARVLVEGGAWIQPWPASPAIS